MPWALTLGTTATMSECLTDEIFGPIPPVIIYAETSKSDELRLIKGLIDKICARPLASYIFSADSEEIDFFKKSHVSGGCAVNETLLHLGMETPFGGVGPSGHGSMSGEFAFLELSHKRAFYERPTWCPDPPFMPPYGESKLMKSALKYTIALRMCRRRVLNIKRSRLLGCRNYPKTRAPGEVFHRKIQAPRLRVLGPVGEKKKQKHTPGRSDFRVRISLA